jgi:hypothetical protein
LQVIESRREIAHLGIMKRGGMTESPEDRWTRAEDYLGAMARKRTFRKSRSTGNRTQPESPRLSLSTIPFLSLMALLAILAVAIMIAAVPRPHPALKRPQVAQKQPGVAAKGWFQEAEKEFHR